MPNLLQPPDNDKNRFQPGSPESEPFSARRQVVINAIGRLEYIAGVLSFSATASSEEQNSSLYNNGTSNIKANYSSLLKSDVIKTDELLYNTQTPTPTHKDVTPVAPSEMTVAAEVSGTRSTSMPLSTENTLNSDVTVASDPIKEARRQVIDSLDSTKEEE